MGKLKELIEKARHRLLDAEKRFEVAGNRWQVNHDLAHEQHKQHKAYERAGHMRKAKRHSRRAFKAHKRALYWIDRVKQAAAQVNHLKETVEQREAKLKKLADRGARWNGHNKVVGPDAKANLELAMRLSMEHGSQYYSQEGPLDLSHGITGPTRGHRHDCSSWDSSIDNAAGLPDRTGNDYNENVWTGNLSEHGEVISESQLDTGCDIFYGTAPFHHVEKKLGPISESNRTVGHGSDPIDEGIVALLPGPRSYRRIVK